MRITRLRYAVNRTLGFLPIFTLFCHGIPTLRNVDPMPTGRFFSLGPSRRFCASFGRHQAVDRSLVAVSHCTATYSMHTLCATHGMPTARPPRVCARNIRSADSQCRLLCLLRCERAEDSKQRCSPAVHNVTKQTSTSNCLH